MRAGMKRTCVVALVGPALACGSVGNGGWVEADAGRDAAAAPFIAVASSFDGFHSWPSIAIDTDLAPGDSHLNGPRHVYYNRAPPPGSRAFPVGTILVKETDPGPVTGRTVFASVKRGGDYDPTGDVDWEWFSLQNLADGTESVIWRGAGPSSGGAYGNGLLGGCNACHGSAKATDYVLTTALDAMIASPRSP
jgi:hypothetical protein